MYCLAGDLDTNVVEADSNVGRVDESSIGSGDTVGGGLGDGGHGDGVVREGSIHMIGRPTLNKRFKEF